jgi:hypothetical protein
MKYIDHKQAVIALLILVGIVLVGCLPAVADETSLQDLNILPTFTETEQPTKTFVPTISPTLAESPLLISTPTQTITQTISVPIQVTNTTVPVVLPTNTKHKVSNPTGTPTPSKTQTITPSPIVTFCPRLTAEPLWVDPVTSPTDQLTQVIMVYIGHGEEVTIKTESGTFTVTGSFNYQTNPAMVEITLLPNTVHHLEVFAKVKSGLSGPGDCVYGGYGLTTTNDRNGAPLTILQGTATP